MSSYIIGYDEKYKCRYCKRFFTDVDIQIRHSWKCPFCNQHIYIAAPEIGHVLIRKPASELRTYDFVVVGGKYVHEVINVNMQKSNIRVALKGFGVKTYSHTDFVSVIEGGYCDDDWKEDLFEPC